MLYWALMFLVIAVRFGMSRDTGSAKRLFLASILYLPLLWILMIADRV